MTKIAAAHRLAGSAFADLGSAWKLIAAHDLRFPYAYPLRIRYSFSPLVPAQYLNCLHYKLNESTEEWEPFAAYYA